MKLSLIIPTFNRQAVLCDTLRMAAAQDYPDYEVIVVDQTDRVSDEVQSTLATLSGQIQYVRQEVPSLPTARNLGIRKAAGEVIVFIDDDVVIQPDYLSRHARHYLNTDTLGGVAGLTWPARFHDEADALAWQSGVCRTKVESRSVVSANEINGGNTSFRKQAVIDAGMFDETLVGTSRGEDSDLSMRVRKCGYELLIDTRIVLIHLEIPSGGCGNRDSNRASAIHREHVELAAYIRIKNWSGYGLGAIWTAVWESYRALALNKTTLRGGLWKITEGHLEWLVVAAKVFARLVRFHGRERAA